MGLLSDPSLTPRNRLGRNLAKHGRKICLLFYIIGLVWFACLALPDFSHGTYLSENALSPGLVYAEVKQDTSRLAQSLLDELRREQTEHKSDIPAAWIVAKMKQIGLETHVHNFTLRYPFAGGKVYQGRNVYGILRGPRISATEGIVFSAPYRPPSSVHTDITASVPMLLAFADFARKKNYWAKDLVFLVTEQEQLGMHAWLEAYYEGGLQDTVASTLSCGNLPARAGALQAALNLEIQDLDFDFIDVKIEGLNGQLPNLDMFNLVQRITVREGISSGYKQTSRKKRRAAYATFDENLKHMASMLLSQSMGVPTGNHGLFHRYRIESLTLEAVKRVTNNDGAHNNNGNRQASTLSLLKTIEGISRSLNNLLERFHQSYFFYILVQNDRFVSIGDFMPCLVLLVGPLFIKAFLLWLTMDDSADADAVATATEKKDLKNLNNEELTDEEVVSDDTRRRTGDIHLSLPYATVLFVISAAFSLGLLGHLLPLNEHLRTYLATLEVSTASAVSLLMIANTFVGLSLPFLYVLPPGGLELLHVGALVMLGVALIVVGLLNFALGFLLAIGCAPLAILINDNAGRRTRTFIRIYTLLLNPLVATYLIVLVLTLFQFPELSCSELLLRAANASMDTIAFVLMDYIIYGNWLYTLITAVFTPLWILYWTLAVAKQPQPNSAAVKEKLN